MAKMMKLALAAVALATATMASDAAFAQGRGGPHIGAVRGGARVFGGFRGYRGYGGFRGYRGFGGPYWYGFAPWGWYPYPAYSSDYYYDYDAYPAPPPPPAYYPEPASYPEPQPPPPRAAAASKDFIVYFPFDSADLTPDAKRVIEDAARYSARQGGGRATIVGYTDAAGSDGYNQTLSEHRSQAVREAMLADGVREGGVNMAWRGKHDLAVKTPDGVKEPANRRVTIVIGRGSEPEEARRDTDDYDGDRDGDARERGYSDAQ